MDLMFVNDYLDKKIVENEDYIRYTFYELRVKNNLSEQEVDKFLELNKIVQDNELIIAIKE